jgi:hypothetical protein
VSWFSVNWKNCPVELVGYGLAPFWGESIVPVSEESITGSLGDGVGQRSGKSMPRRWHNSTVAS